MKINLQDLLPAKAQDEMEPPKEAAQRRHDMRVVRAETKAKLVAQEYVRNGMDFIGAYNTVVGANYPKHGKGHLTAYRLLGKSMDVFVAELQRLLSKTDISRERALHILWTMVNASVLDFLDDNGDTLPVRELKKLPRVMQLLISEIEVHRKQVVAKGADGKELFDDNGRPYLLNISHVKLKIPDKLTAFRQLAEVMRWVGPAVQVNNYNVGSMMSEQDAQTKRIEQVYDGEFSEVRKD